MRPGFFCPSLTYAWGITGLNFALFITLFSALTLMMISAPLERDEIGRIAMLSFAWLYVPYLLSFVLLIWDLPDGRSLGFVPVGGHRSRMIPGPTLPG